ASNLTSPPPIQPRAKSAAPAARAPPPSASAIAASDSVPVGEAATNAAAMAAAKRFGTSYERTSCQAAAIRAAAATAGGRKVRMVIIMGVARCCSGRRAYGVAISRQEKRRDPAARRATVSSLRQSTGSMQNTCAPYLLSRCLILVEQGLILNE